MIKQLLKDIRMVKKEGVTWYNFADVCKVLEISNPMETYMKVDDKDVNFDGIDGYTYVLEPIVYKLALESDSLIGKQFQQWVFDDVVTSIIRTGEYRHKEEPNE